MSKRLACAVSLLFFGLLAGASFAFAGDAPTPSVSDYTLDQVKAMSSAPVRYAGDTVSGMPISPSQVPEGSSGSAGGAYITGNVCWFQDKLWTEWGTWPFQQRVTEWRYWCANYVGGPQTGRSSSVHLGTTLCSKHDE